MPDSGVESKFSRAEQSIGPIFASLESRADGDDAFSEEDLDFEEEYVRALLFDEIIAPSSSSSSSSSAFASNSNVHGAIVDSARRSSNGIVLIVDGTLFPRRLDRVPAPQANGSSSPIPSRPPPTPTPQFLSVPPARPHHQLKDHRHQSLVHSIQYIGKHARRLRPQLLEVRASRRRHHLLQKARASRCFQIFAGCVISRTTPHRAAVTVSARKLEIVVRTMPWSACRSTVEEI